jgi:hypothetical protein
MALICHRHGFMCLKCQTSLLCPQPCIADLVFTDAPLRVCRYRTAAHRCVFQVCCSRICLDAVFTLRSHCSVSDTSGSEQASNGRPCVSVTTRRARLATGALSSTRFRVSPERRGYGDFSPPKVSHSETTVAFRGTRRLYNPEDRTPQTSSRVGLKRVGKVTHGPSHLEIILAFGISSCYGVWTFPNSICLSKSPVSRYDIWELTFRRNVLP